MSARTRTRTRAAAAGVGAVAAGAVVAVLLLSGGSEASTGATGYVGATDGATSWTDGTDGTAGAATATAVVEQRDLVVVDEVEGELGFGTTYDVAAGREGTVTDVPVEGTVVAPGSVLLEVDTEPTVLLRGDVPAWRELGTGSADGADVQQLEQALVDLGHGDGITVDQEFTDSTAEAVDAWETDLGRADPDGTVAAGDVVFTSADVRVHEAVSPRGSQVQASSTVLTLTATARVVDLQVSTRAAERLEPGAAAEVTLPDGSTVAATVSSVAARAETGPADPEGEPTVAVELALDDPASAAAWDTGTVDVRLERSRTAAETAVPVEALLALAEGGYALEVTVGGTTSLVAVEVGTIADGWVQVSGDGVTVGTVVVVPA